MSDEQLQLSPEQQAAEQRIADLERSERDLLQAYQSRLSTPGPIGYQHYYLFGIARRTLAQSRAFKACVADKNGLVALALVRLQLDTALRLYALFWVSDPEIFAKDVFEGKQIDRLKAADGKLMKDKYLLERIEARNPWAPSVYRNTSGLVHFSHRHIKSALRIEDSATGKAQIFIGPNNPEHVLSDFKEMLDAFLHINMMIVVAVQDWFARFDNFKTECSSERPD
jgi:hypothetical protein